jgi:orotidine-5'-phosphate decarboxylase
MTDLSTTGDAISGGSADVMVETGETTPPGPGTGLVPFGERLAAARADSGFLCVGIDPHASELASWSLPDTAGGTREYALRMLEAVTGRVACVKPQSAFFERHGSAGVAVLEELLAAARDLGVLVLLDVKRGDIGSTAAAYAQAYLDRSSPLAADAMTASPYLGVGALDPFFEAATTNGAGVFVLAMTSNPEGRDLQGASVRPGLTVAGEVLAAVAARNAASPGGSFGAVVGATIGSTTEDLRIGGPLLAPGLGAQGATAADLPGVFGAALPDVLPSVSRGISKAGPDVSALRAAVATYEADLRTVLR